MPQRASALAEILAHEVYHRRQPFGEVRGSLYEELFAYQLQDAVMAELAAEGWGVRKLRWQACVTSRGSSEPRWSSEQ
ncbi:MAG: hypothetical protein A2Z66_00515 [Chloroflexi bacterium RBG_13_66_10]|nr:MAG: hypothetical protein A2Z66_00515 [Chloroflexi bacterium RBG_13_66_10]